MCSQSVQHSPSGLPLPADEVHFCKDGNNNYEVVEQISLQATRWGLTTTPYNNRWQELRVLFKWVTGDATYLECDEVRIVEEAQASTPRWYYKDDTVPALGVNLVSRLIVLPFLTPVEARANMSEQCIPPLQAAGQQLVAGNYGTGATEKCLPLLTFGANNSEPAPKRCKPSDTVHETIEDWVTTRKNSLGALSLLGESATPCSWGHVRQPGDALC